MRKELSFAIVIILITLYSTKYFVTQDIIFGEYDQLREPIVAAHQRYASLGNSHSGFSLRGDFRTIIEQSQKSKCFQMIDLHIASHVRGTNLRFGATGLTDNITRLKGPLTKLSPDDLCAPALIRDYIHPKNKYELNHRMVINGSQTTCDENTFLLIIILSTDLDKERRDIIRTTWGTLAQKTSEAIHIDGISFGNIRYMFLLGSRKDKKIQKEVLQESALHGDIVQGDFTEEYHSITYKTLMGIQWMKKQCLSVKFVMKADDDVFINIPSLVRMLAFEAGSHSKLLIGHCLVSRTVVRRQNANQILHGKKEKWGLLCEEYPYDNHPPYTSGHGYVMTSTLASDLYELSKRVKPYKVEDNYLTGIVRNLIGKETELFCPDGFSEANRPVPNVGLKNLFTVSVKAENISCYNYFWEDILSKYSISLY